MDSTHKEISVSPARMGRPPLGKKAEDTKPIPVRLDISMRARINSLVEHGESVAAFIRQAVEREIERREKK